MSRSPARARHRRSAALSVLALVVGLLTGMTTGPAHAETTTSITVDGTKPGLTFDGIGAISGGGGNSRLLVDYPEPQRSQILDYLFKPGYGASLQILKIEVGGDSNSTDGAEASHEHARGTIDCNQGYEWWLAAQAKARNPHIKIAALSWAAPGWVGGGSNTFYTDDAVTYLMDWMGCAAQHNLTVDYLGGWNERYNGYAGDNSSGARPWFVKLKNALVAHGYATKVVAGDDGWSVADDMASDSAFDAAVDVVGVHYPCGYLASAQYCPSTGTAQGLGKPLWASENGSQDATDGAAATARAINRDYTDGRMTGYINWPLVAGIYPNLHFSTDGLVVAQQPWSGSYQVGPTTWAMAHTGQFTAPGWRYIDSASGALGGWSGNGTYVTLKSPDSNDYSTVIETMDASGAQTAQFSVTGGLSTGTVHVWATDLRSADDATHFVHQADITPSAGTYSLTLQPGYVYTVTTTTTVPGTGAAQGKGATTRQLPKPLALPYRDGFDTAATTTSPKYFTDMNGAFATVPCAGSHKGTCLQQMAPAAPVHWTGESYADPYTFMGDISWSDYTVSTDTDLTQSGSVELLGRVNDQGRNNNGLNAYHLRVSNTGAWSILRSDTSWNFTTLASGTVKALGTNAWHNVALTMQGSILTAKIDGRAVGSTNDSTFSQGMAGLGVVGYQTDQFDNFSVAAAGSAATSHIGPINSVLDSSKCVDADRDSGANGTVVQLWGCNGGASQAWTYTNGSLLLNGKCLDVGNQSTANGTPVALWECNGGANQKWYAKPDGSLVSGMSDGICLDDPAAATADGTPLEIWSCNGGANQKWRLP
ncbi:ricin-type beta-trefoil lectin domain protein [Streptomyces sp. NPDC020917]|uniref:ricin-type beta-trefoil lectin domain protein n=1 Tax=Streptomyces sp. NPDC020917 TaxID=3365102 RepID=UPI0037ACA5AF